MHLRKVLSYSYYYSKYSIYCAEDSYTVISFVFFVRVCLIKPYFGNKHPLKSGCKDFVAIINKCLVERNAMTECAL